MRMVLPAFWIVFGAWVGWIGYTTEYIPIRIVCGALVLYCLYFIFQGIKRRLYENDN